MPGISIASVLIEPSGPSFENKISAGSRLSQNRNSVTMISTPVAPANGLSQPVERSVERNGKFTVSVYCHCSLLSDEPKNRSRKKTVTQPSCQCSHGTFGRADS